MLREYREL
jgi:hypothetical protein